MDYLSEMALFVEVANAMSFSKAAAKLAMPQSTLSRWSRRSACRFFTALRAKSS